MTNIVSIDWSVEEFRRLIGEQPHSSSVDSRLQKTIRVLGFEVGPPSESTDYGSTMEKADSPDVQVTGEGSLSLDTAEVVATEKDNASGWTVADVIATAEVQGERSEEPTSLHMGDTEVVLPRKETDRFSTNESACSSEIETAAPDARTAEEWIVSAAPIEPDVPKALKVSNRRPVNRPAPTPFAEVRIEELRSTLEKAIAEPGIHTSKADRDRAIDLRWILRDIRANRLKSLQSREHDLNVLIEFGLVEMRDSVPQLTNAGVNAII
jgi:hypothetical protein